MLPIPPPHGQIKPLFDTMMADMARSIDDAPNSLDAALSVSADGGLPFDDGLVFYFEVYLHLPSFLRVPCGQWSVRGRLANYAVQEHDGCRTPMPDSRGTQVRCLNQLRIAQM
jgi:hypothetical protein